MKNKEAISLKKMIEYIDKIQLKNDLERILEEI